LSNQVLVKYSTSLTLADTSLPLSMIIGLNHASAKTSAENNPAGQLPTITGDFLGLFFNFFIS
jgi:hypothetical protein